MSSMQRGWPSWWEWDIELTPHVEKRMEDRGFTEVDLRGMIECAHGYREDAVVGRWLIETRHRRRLWHVIMEPDEEERLSLVITAYPVTE